MKILQGVQYVPTLAHNLLSVGQLMKGGFSILFGGNACVIIDKKSRQTVANMLVTQNNMFPFDISNAGSNALVVKGKNEPNLCHLRYGHLHINGLKLLRQKDIAGSCQKWAKLTCVKDLFTRNRIGGQFQ